MEKVAFISVYKDGGGYSTAAIEHILSLDSIGVQVVPRHIKMTQTSGYVPDRILELEQNNLDNVDAIIQYNLPSEFVYKGNVQNIGIFDYETVGLPNNTWETNIKMMDKIIVHHDNTENGYEKYNKNFFVCPVPVDSSKYNKTYNKLDIPFTDDTLKFYTISEYNNRKNIPALIAAYLNSFTISDNVVLILKLSGGSHVETIIKGIIDDLKIKLGRFNMSNLYPKVLVCTDRLSDDDLYGMHQGCSCFVSASHGEGFCLPAIDAMGFGNMVIASATGAFLSYVPESENILVPGTNSMCLGVENSPVGLYSGDEQWFNINISKLSLAMKIAYNNRKHLFGEVMCGLRQRHVIDKFDRKTVGKQLLDIIRK